MDFVDNIDFFVGRYGRDSNFFAQVTDIIDAVIAGGVDFDNIEGGVVFVVGQLIDGVRQDTGDGCFADATRTSQ